MINIQKKIDLYKKEKEYYKSLNLEKFLSVDEKIINDYLFFSDKEDTYKYLALMSASSLIESLGCLIYAFSIDIDLKEDIYYIFKLGINPVIDDLKEPTYIYFVCLSIISYILNIKFIELSNNYKNAKKVLEYDEPDLKCYKYIR